MELKPGYKRTEVGVIPVDWSVVTFKEVTHLITCGLAATPTYVPEFVGKPFLSAQNVRDGRVVFDNHKFIDRKLFEQITRHNKPGRGDLLYTRVGAGIGEAGIIESDVEFGIYVSLTLIKTDTGKLHNGFATHLLNSPRYRTLAKSGQFAGAGVQNLNVEVVRRFPIPLPSVREQRAIAEALSDVDGLLDGLDRLIAKKRDLKQAAMQQLLTGQTRLPGEWLVKPGYKQTEVGVIPDDWKIMSFKEQFNISAGGDVNLKLSSPEQDDVHRYPIYSNALTRKGLYGYCSYADHPQHSLTITARGTLGVATYRDHKYTAIGRVLVLEPKQKSAGLFFAEFINSRVKFAIESTGVPQLTAPQISDYSLAVPPYHEQRAIAEVLSDIDAELAALEQRREKTRALKRAMMQELLTGKTRLVTVGEYHARTTSS